MKNLNIETVYKIKNDDKLLELYCKRLAQKAIIEIVKVDVNKVKKQVFSNFTFYDDARAEKRDRKPIKLQNDDLLYLSNDEQNIEKYYEALQLAYYDNGMMKNIKKGCCPLLTQESNYRKLGWEILDILKSYWGIDKNKYMSMKLENRMIDLTEQLLSDKITQVMQKLSSTL